VTSAITATDGSKVEAKVTRPLPLVGVLAAWAETHRVDLPDLEVSRPSLENIYLRLTQES
jgi:hypothetical protein